MTIMKRLQEERERLFGFSRVDFAQQCGVGEKVEGDWENGKSFPDAQALKLMAESGADVYYIVTGKTGPRTEEESLLLYDYQRCQPDSQRGIRDLAAKEAEKADAVKQENDSRFGKLFGGL